MESRPYEEVLLERIAIALENLAGIGGGGTSDEIDVGQADYMTLKS